MSPRPTTVFGGSGFLGRRIVAQLVRLGQQVRVASRHPARSRGLFRDLGEAVRPVEADVGDDRSVAEAVAGAGAVVNAVSLYVERHGRTFHGTHVEAARRVAEQARSAGVQRLVHVSGIGADPRSASPYIRSRGEGERAVHAGFPGATIIRPAVMFGVGDAFVTPLAALLRRLPAMPVFGRGTTRMQPAAADDVAAGAARALSAPSPAAVPAAIYEFGGATVHSYAGLLHLIGRHVGRSPALIPVPFGAWQAAAWLAEWLPRPPVTRSQVELMRQDNVPRGDLPGLRDLGIEPATLEESLPEIVRAAQDPQDR